MMDGMVWSLAAAMFTTGMLGGLSHCAGMCGPFVLAQVGALPAGTGQGAGIVLARARGSMLLPYHLGRITTYAGLGGLVAAGGGTVTRLAGVSWGLALILMLAALLFLRQGLLGLAPWLPAGLRRWLAAGTGGGCVQGLGRRLTVPLRPLFAQPGGINGYLLGLVLGLLPCGLVYAGLASAMGTGDPLAGTLMMAAFGAGTVPALLAIGLLGGAAANRWRRLAFLATPVLMLVNAAIVARMAWHMLG
ncbi:sulfite exporter TauE/SafE family protein [Niveispirillum fermenti]|uniref:sulfite exporter TauE/SafE family protein n=1 Tax=Niveispirillum fermenti TaxID=1233113 RepID=UPI003A84CCCB